MKFITNISSSDKELLIKKEPSFVFTRKVPVGTSLEVTDDDYRYISGLDPLIWEIKEQSEIIQEITASEVSEIAVASNTFYVDKNKPGTYTEDGSILKPFRTITTAINKIISNDDNDTIPYAINIVGPGTYTETLSFNNAHLYDVTINGYDTIIINPTSGNSIICDTNNTNLRRLQFNSILFSKPVDIEVSTDGLNVFSEACLFNNCTFSDSLLVKNISNFNCLNSQIKNITVENVAYLFISNVMQSGSQTNLVWNPSNPKPAGSTEVNFNMQQSESIASWSIGAGVRAILTNVKLIDATTSAIVNGILESYFSWFYGALLINNAASFINNSSFYNPANLTINVGATFTNNSLLGCFNVYKSGLRTGTGALQTFPHGLGYQPTEVIISVLDNNGGNFVVTEGFHDSTNINVTVTLGVRYKIVAY